MQEISSSRFAGIIETDGALITGVRGFVRSLLLRQAGVTADMTTSHLTDKTTSHSTRLSKDDNQVAGYNPARDAGQVIGYSHSTRLSAEELLAGHPKDDSQVAGYQHERPFNLFHAGLSNFLGRMNKTLFLSPTASLVSRHEVAIMYFGRTSDFLMMTSERMVIPTGRYTLGQLLCSLYKRGDRWAYELDDSHLMCTVNGRDASLFDMIEAGAEICLSSRKSIFEA